MERDKQSSADALRYDTPTLPRADDAPAPRVYLTLPIVDDEGPSPGDVRRSILREHAEIRCMLSELETEATNLLAISVPNEEAAHKTRELALSLCATMKAHVSRENRVLFPMLTELDAWGPVRARQLVDDHARQLLLFQAYAGMLVDGDVTPQTLALTAWQLVRSIYADMEEEETTILSAELLRDDGIGSDVESG